MDLGIAGRVALVTGASKGLGRASAVALAQEGARVAICARGEAALREAEAELRDIAGSRGGGGGAGGGASDGSGDVLGMVMDVTDPAAPAELVRQVVEHFGSLDILVPNAAGPPPGRSLDVDEETIERALNANFMTSARLVREAVPHMRARGWGRICMITSSSIKQPIPTLSLSNSSRVALWSWAKTAAADLFADGITLNTVCPGLHATDRIKELDIGADVPIGDPRDFGKVVAFLCSDPAAFVSGAAVLVDAGRYAGLF